MKEKMVNEKTLKPIIIILGIILAVGFIYTFFSFVFALIDFDDDEIKFCNDQGWAYTSGYNNNSETIWCGAMSSDGFQGITYPVYKNWIGKYKVKEDFDVNLYLSQQRYSKLCEENCRSEYSTPMNQIDYDNELCGCFNWEDIENSIIINLSREDLNSF